MKILPHSRIGKIFFAAVILIILLFIFILAMEIYGRVSGVARVEQLAKRMEQLEKEDYARKAADTLGGKTPEETLEMFISAVESGDYKLASKYFVIEKQGEWREELMDIKNNGKIDIFLGPILETQKVVGEYSEERDTYSIHDPILVSFILYPFGNWKIERI